MSCIGDYQKNSEIITEGKTQDNRHGRVSLRHQADMSGVYVD